MNRPLPIIAAALVAFCLAAAPAFDQVKSYKELKYPELRPFEVPQPERTVLPNGMVLMLLEDHELPVIELFARVRGGARLEPSDKVGLGAIFGQTLRTGGTKTMTGDQIDDFLEARAATVETGVGDEFTEASLSCLVQDFPEVLKVFADVIRGPVFAEDKIKLAKNQVSTGISRRNDNPQQIMNREFEKLVYGSDSPYARVPEYASVEKISREDLLAFHKTYFQPNRIIIGVVGDFSAKDMAARIRATFGDWPKGPATKDPEAAYQATNKPGVYYIQKEDMTQSDIIMGHLGIRRDNPDYFAVEVLNEAFGGSFAARLFSNVRSRKGLAYSVRGAVASNYDYPGTFNTWMTTKTETTAAGIDALLSEIGDIVNKPPTEDEVRRAKESILNSFIFRFDSRGRILGQQVTYEYFNYPADFLARYRANIEKVTTAEVARVAKKYIHKDQLSILVVGPSKGQDRPLESFGKVSRLDITIPEPKGAAAPAASAESLVRGKSLFARVIEGLGGAAAIDSVKAIRTVSANTVKTAQGEMTIKVVSTLALPDRIRQELDTPMGMMVRVVSGAEGFMNTPMGPQPMPDSQRTDMGKAIRRLPIVMAQHRNDPDFKVQHAGQEEVEGTKVEALVISGGGEEVKILVDPSTGRILRQIYRGQSQAGPGEFVATFSDFRAVSGLTLPFKSQVTMNGEPMQSSVSEEIAVNPAVDATIFAKPAAESPAGAKDGQ
ncbi:MAG TPA: pitrilysin family protein [Candidatus Polarisedimenticolia bacterium]|jgi:predicted Zn-dependent peptidase